MGHARLTGAAMLLATALATAACGTGDPDEPIARQTVTESGGRSPAPATPSAPPGTDDGDWSPAPATPSAPSGTDDGDWSQESWEDWWAGQNNEEDEDTYSYSDCPTGGLEITTRPGSVDSAGSWSATVTVRNTSPDFTLDVRSLPDVSAHELGGSPFGSDGEARGVVGQLSPGWSEGLEYAGTLPDYTGGPVSLDVSMTTGNVSWVPQDPFPDDYTIDSTCGQIPVSNW